ncbi:MAG: ATP synthase subunit alpha [Candidatus Atribacteria bacterium ADurb.Bin276]|uniref:ATP synthase subunit alpha n=1 Tax=Candidatus Atribacter allofermentans TaxID=1852833 RepID=A0A1V5T1L9_9BACT|nr:MAG: ATP synthase subunit alpha [Candidatus Atribacteria bacterium ADurb.Bin276]
MVVITDTLKKAIQVVREYVPVPEINEIGEVTEVQDGVISIAGLKEAMMGEMLIFPHGLKGQVFNLEKERISCILFGDYSLIHQGDRVFRTNRVLEVPVGDELLGRIIDPLGNPLDGKPIPDCRHKRPIMQQAPEVIQRQPVHRPLFTGIKTIDAMIPLGKGQRELIIGDRRTGKTTIAIDTIINQKGKNVVCVYVAIGKRLSAITEMIDILKRYNALAYTIIVSTSAEDSPAFLYLAPYSGCTIAEFFMNGGQDVLVVYDDLSKHAVAYRSLSLLMRRSPGRESYPGDIFYLHSRLLERSAQLSDDLGGGSMSALPIVETQEGDISAYIPTNIISITDGQIYLESNLFAKGFLPPINIGLSVSRVGGEAQTPIMKKVARRLRLDLAQYFELEDFARFSSELDVITARQLEHGKRVLELTTQIQYQPLDISMEILAVYAATQGLIDHVPLPLIKKWEVSLYQKAISEKADLLNELWKEKELDSKFEQEIKEFIRTFTEHFLLQENVQS